MFTVCILEPCCPVQEPGYTPPPRSPFNRVPGYSPLSCGHRDKRVATLTTHDTQSLAEAWFNGRARGWYSTDGWLFDGEMPSEGERFRIVPVGGSLATARGYLHGAPVEIPFPTIEQAREYAEAYHEYPDGRRHRQVLFNIVGDQDTLVRWSSYGVGIGTELEAGAWA